MEYTNQIVALSTDEQKAAFYKKTYLHVALAILAFIVVEGILLSVVPAELIIGMVTMKFAWLFLIGAFWLASTLASKWSLSQSRSVQ